MLVFNDETGEWEEDGYGEEPPPEELGDGGGYDYLPEEPPVDDSGNLIPLNPDEPPTELDPDELRRETQKEIWGTPPDDKSKSFLDQISTLPSYVQNLFKAKFTDGKGNIDWGNLVGAGAGLVGAYNAYKQAEAGNKPTGYQGGIPSYTAVQGRAAEPVAGSRPGAGHQYFTGVKFAPAAGLPAAKAAIDAQVTDLNKLNTGNSQARTVAPEKTTDTWTRPDGTPVINSPATTPEDFKKSDAYKKYQELGLGAVTAPPPSQNSSMTPDDFMKSDDYKKYQADSANQMGTNDMYTSPYFGRQTSGSYGRGLDKAYEIARNNQSGSTISSGSPEKAATPGGLTTKNLQGGVDALSKSFMDEVIRKNDKLNPSGNFVDGVVPPPTQPVIDAAHGGIMGLARGGKPTHPRGTYLRGNTDGMADKIPGTIDGIQPARLAHGEFVIPADVVSHLGNGNSDAGAKQLYKMMDRIRMARTGSEKQSKEINPSKFMPGGLASYAAGGGVARFANEGAVKPAIPATATGTESNLSNWAGPYVTDLLGKTQALTNAALETPQFYQGELTADSSALQNKAYDQAGTLTGQSFTNAGTAGSYMSPYMQNVVDIQKREAQRQSGIQGTQQQAQAAQAGAFGGSRDAIMRAERERNLGTQMNDIQAQGLQSAFNAAQNQYNTEQNKNVTNINTLANLGNTQQATTQAGLVAAKAQFDEQKADPYKQLQFQQSMLQGMPVQAQSYNTTTNPYSAAAAGATGTADLFSTIFKP